MRISVRIISGISFFISSIPFKPLLAVETINYNPQSGQQSLFGWILRRQ